MAESVPVTCPECGKKMNIRPDIIGKKIRCKGCDEVYVARGPKTAVTAKPKAKPAAKAPAEAADKPAPLAFKQDEEEEEGSNPYGITDVDDSSRCPECANEMESAEAIICLQCGYNTQTRLCAGMRITHDITGLDQFIWLFPGIAAILGCICLLTADIIFCMFWSDWMMGSDFEWTAHYFFKFWGSICTAFAVFYLGRFAIKRLVFNYTVPEVEIKK